MICSKYQKALNNCVITSYILRIDESLEFFDKKKMYLITSTKSWCQICFHTLLVKNEIYKACIKGEGMGEYKSLYVSSCRISLMTQFPSNSHANLTAKRRKRGNLIFTISVRRRGCWGNKCRSFKSFLYEFRGVAFLWK